MRIKDHFIERLLSRVVATAVCIALFTSCSVHRAHFEYQEFENRIPIRPGGWDGELIGPVAYDAKGAIWDDCTAIAKMSVWGIIDKTRAVGGNAIGNIRWIPRDGGLTIPHCKKRWWYVVFWPLLLTPLFMSATVNADAYRVKDPNATRAGVYMIPSTRLAAFVERIVNDVMVF